MSRSPVATTLALALLAGSLAFFSTAADPPRSKAAASDRKPDEGELFPEVAPGGAKPTPKIPAPKTPATRSAKPLPPKRLPPAVASRPATQPSTAPSTFVATHRITLVTHRVIDGIPTHDGQKLIVKVELGSVSVEQSQVEKIEPLPIKPTETTKPPESERDNHRPAS